MTRVYFSSSRNWPLVFYLAAEEYVAGLLHSKEAFFTWRVNPTVIYGHNQDAEAEINALWCKENGVQVVRRRSGGGCVYADMGNLMLSYICDGIMVEEAFSRFLSMLAGALRDLGLDAHVSGRNDVIVGGSKVSGNACYTLGDRSIVHGTLLYDVNLEAMQHAITPPQEKLRRHAVASVRQRVTNIKPLLTPAMPLEQLQEWISIRFCDSAVKLTPAQEQEIEALSLKYII